MTKIIIIILITIILTIIIIIIYFNKKLRLYNLHVVLKVLVILQTIGSCWVKYHNGNQVNTVVVPIFYCVLDC